MNYANNANNLRNTGTTLENLSHGLKDAIPPEAWHGNANNNQVNQLNNLANSLNEEAIIINNYSKVLDQVDIFKKNSEKIVEYQDAIGRLQGSLGKDESQNSSIYSQINAYQNQINILTQENNTLKVNIKNSLAQLEMQPHLDPINKVRFYFGKINPFSKINNYDNMMENSGELVPVTAADSKIEMWLGDFNGILGRLFNKSEELGITTAKMNSELNQIESYEDINPGKASLSISGFLGNACTNLNNLISNIKGYVENILDFDIYDKNNEENNMSHNIPTGTVLDPNMPQNTTPQTFIFNNGPKTDTLTFWDKSVSGEMAQHIVFQLGLINPCRSQGKRGSTGPFTVREGDPNVDITKYRNNEAYGFNVTNGNLAYDLSDADYDLICAVVSCESDQTYDDALAVTSTILNRCERENWRLAHSPDPIAQMTAPGQYVVYGKGSYKRYLNGKSPDRVKIAVKDCLNGVRNNNYLSYRANYCSDYSSNMISDTGNRFV